MIVGAGQSYLDAFFQVLRRSADRPLLMLDYDGTLAPFNANREMAVPYPGVHDVLTRISALGRSRLVIISGRSIRDVLDLLELKPQPEIWGSHGWERLLPDGTYSLASLPDDAQRGLSEAYSLAETAKILDRCEKKPASVALHWRGLDPTVASTLLSTIGGSWSDIAKRHGLRVHAFDGGVEIRAEGHDKGTAVRTLLAEMSPTSPVAYLGDDLTDEDAFEAVEGLGLNVLVRPEPRTTRARVWLRPPQELLEFLDYWRLADERSMDIGHSFEFGC